MFHLVMSLPYPFIDSLIHSFPEHYASVTLILKDKGDETEVNLEARGVPTNEEERTKEGWQRYYFESIKQTFGFGARLY